MPRAPEVFGGKERRQQRERDRGTNRQRGYDSRWREISKRYRAANPVCEICRNAVAVDVDHIQPFSGMSDPLRTEPDNLQAVCRACHRVKTRDQWG